MARSVIFCNGCPVNPAIRTVPRFALALAGIAIALAPSALAQLDDTDEPLLPLPITNNDIELRGRYAREMLLDDGTRVMEFDGRFRLNFGQRQMTADRAVVWVERLRTEPVGEPYFAVSAYLSGTVELVDLGGTITQDETLYVSGMKTTAKIVKYHDAFVEEDLSTSELYAQAARAREVIEAGGQRPGKRDVIRPREIPELNPDRPPRVIRYRLDRITTAVTAAEERVLVATGGIYLSRGGSTQSGVVEILANNAVIFLSKGEPSEKDDVQAIEADAEPSEAPQGWKDLIGRLEAVYLEGDVRLAVGERFIRTERLLYDFSNDKALIVDAVFHAQIPDRDVPIYVRAAEVRQVSPKRFTAVDAKITTDEFYTPHYHVGAQRIDMIDRRERDAAGKPIGGLAGTFAIEHATFNVGDVPIAYWPYLEGDFEVTEQPLRSLAASYNSEYGVSLETRWYLYTLLGIQRPPGYDATMRLDYFSERGPALGIDGDYERKNYFGLLRSYYIYDDGEDDLGPLRGVDNTPDDQNRGRFTWRHRHYLANDWEAVLEFSYISDPNFLETFERDEFWEGKQQESLIYLKRARDTEAVTLLTQWRMLDFLTQTEHLPEVTYRRIGDTFLSPVVLYHESRVGGVRRRVDDRNFFEYRRFSNEGSSNATLRVDVRQEAELPLKLGPVNVVPFATVRGTHWGAQPLDEGALTRGFSTYGLRGGTALHRDFNDVQSELLDINQLRHVIKPEFVVWNAHSNMRSDQIWQFDEGVETIDDFYGGMVAIRQTLQTKRGYGDKQHVIDLLTFDLEAGFFGDAFPGDEAIGWTNPLRPEDSRARNYLAGELNYRLSDTTALLYDFNVDLNDWTFDRHNVSLAVERSPRLAYMIGYRQASDIDFEVIGGGLNYKLNEKHTLASRLYYDLDHGQLGEFAIAYVRRLPRWYVAVSVEWDDVFDDVGVSISVWPEGIPEWAIGSRRFTSLSRSTGLRP